MPEVSQYSLSYRELMVALIKAIGVHEGKWVLSVVFAFTALNAGPDGGEVVPTALVGVQKLGLQRADETSAPSMVVDAAEVNPK